MCSQFRRMGLFLALLMTLGLLLTPAALAQNRGFGGKVTNDKGEPVANAVITIRGTTTNRTYPTKTDKKGEWVYMNLPIGTYWIVARADGYSPAAKQEEAKVGMTAVNLTLSPGDPKAKLPFELTPEEQEKLKEEQKRQQEMAKAFGEIKASFEAGRSMAELGKYPEAIAEFKKALEKAPDEPTVLANLADAQMKAGQNDEALATYKRVLDKKPDDAALWINYGTVLNQLGKTAESREAFQKAADLNPGARGQSMYNLGVTLMNAQQTKEAADAFRQSIAADANYAEAYYRLGQCLLSDAATMDEAVKMFEKYISIGKDPANLATAKEIVAALKVKK